MDEISKIEGPITDLAGEGFYSLLKEAIETMPYVNKLFFKRQLNQIERRVKKYAPQLRTLTYLNGTSKFPEEFIQEKIGPIVFADFIEEHEDAKILYILNGFQHVFFEENPDENIIYNHFDTLRSLRYGHVRRLFYHAGLDEVYPTKENVNRPEYQTYSKSIDTKLKSMDLIHIPTKFDDLDGKEWFEPEVQHDVLAYGREFLSFIKTKHNIPQ
jgi:hypothetical protein